MLNIQVLEIMQDIFAITIIIYYVWPLQRNMEFVINYYVENVEKLAVKKKIYFA
jgi:hypothetical protein